MGFEAGVYTIRESRRRVELPIVITDPPSGGAPWPFTLLLNTHGNSAGIQYIYAFACEITVFYVVQTLQVTLRLKLTVK